MERILVLRWIQLTRILLFQDESLLEALEGRMDYFQGRTVFYGGRTIILEVRRMYLEDRTPPPASSRYSPFASKRFKIFYTPNFQPPPILQTGQNPPSFRGVGGSV